VLWFLSAIAISIFTKKDEPQIILSAFMLGIVTAEGLLMNVDVTKTYLEKRSGVYQSLFHHQSTNSVWAYLPNSRHRLTTPEYDYERTTNSFGFSDVEWQRDTSKILIQTYGDSFTEGDGAPADSSYPAILRTLLGKNYQVQNYGICGNDPGFYVTQFDKIGSRFKPDVIILSYGTFDFLTDVMSRGGLDRFTPSGWQTRKGHWWEVIYAMSHISRLFFHAAGIRYSNFFMSDVQRKRELKNLEPRWNEIFAEIARLAEIHHTKILLFKKPERSEIVNNAYEYNMAFFDSFLIHYPAIHHLDLLPFYRAEGLTDIPGTEPYYWPKDGHHNSRGYAMMAKGVFEGLNGKFKEYLDFTSPLPHTP
jgi:lysophospholipase L1-like esterase